MFNQGEKVDKRNVQDLLPLTRMQAGMLYHYLNDSENDHYFEQISLDIKGQIDLPLMEKAWRHVIEVNEMLRTIFRWEKLEKPLQIVLKKYQVPITSYNLSDLTHQERRVRLEEIKRQDREGIDLTSQPFRVTLILSNDKELTMIITYHHILYDGWSNGIILKEFIQAYNTLCQGISLEMGDKDSFKQFVKILNNKTEDEAKKYWIEYLEEFDTRTPLPPVDKGSQGGVEYYNLELDPKITGRINQFTRNKKITMAALVYTIWGIILQRYNNSDDIIFGTTVSGRNGDIPGIEEMVGLFINTIPLRMRGDGEKTILHLLKEVDDDLRERTRYENVPLVEINSYSALGNKEGLFDSIVVIENYPLDRQFDESNLLQIDSYSISEATNFDLTISVEIKESITIQFIYNSSKYDKTLIEGVGEHFYNVMLYILENPGDRLSEVKLLSAEDLEEILVHFNSTDTLYPANKTLVEIFESQVDRLADNTALIYQEEKLTYRELNQKSNRLARLLRQKGVKRNDIVGIKIKRSLEMIVGIWGILKAGAAYLPISPDSPGERTNYILEDSGVQLLLTSSSLSKNITHQLNGEIIELDKDDSYHWDNTNLDGINKPEDLAYLIYTSGTTGRPKGTLISHTNLISLVKDTNYLQVNEDDRFIQLSNYIFDGSVFDIFASLLNGASLVLINKETLLDIDQLVYLIQKRGVTQFLITTALFNALVEATQDEMEQALVNVKKIYFGGEGASLIHVRQAFDQLGPDRLINLYGPTEGTVVATYYPVNSKEGISSGVPIGKPISNTQIHILNKHLQLQPPGAWGELTISGPGIAAGYLNRPKLTAEKFIENPFTGEKMYKTGDLARWLDDGNIEFGGRIDQQVQIRGFRIEPGEIEGCLLEHDSIKEAVVIDLDYQGNKYLVAYYSELPDNQRELTVEELKEYLSQSLPDYMVPSYFIKIEALPLTANGKIDRKALPEPDLAGLKREYVEPVNETEEKLIEIWSQILGVGQIGTTDDFFELGGHSLKATVLVSRIHKEFEVELPLEQVFDNPTIKEMAQYILKLDQSSYQAIEKIAEADYYPTSSAQKRMYMLQQLDRESTSYNLPGVIEIRGGLDLEKMEQILFRLIERHESLRTKFKMKDDRLVQIIEEEIPFRLEYYQNEEQIDQIISDFIRPFDLENGPLFRAGVVSLKDRYLFMLDMHHIISDGVSVQIFIDEFAKLYDGQELEELPIQYKDFSHWQNQIFDSEKFQMEKKFWLDTFSDGVPILNLPTDYPRGRGTDFSGDTYKFNLSKDIYQKLERLKEETGTTLYMILLAAYNIFLAKYSGEEDIVVGTPVACREHPDLEQMIGMFVNTLALRNRVKMADSFKELLAMVKDNSLQAFQNQNYQFEMLVNDLGLERDQSRNPLFDTMFSLQKDFNSKFEIEGLSLQPLELENKSSKFDLTLDGYQTEDGLYFTFEYSTHLFKKKTMERMAEHFLNILNGLATRPGQPLAELEIISPVEKWRVLEEFNSKTLQYPTDKTFVQVFEQNIDNWRDKVAVSYHNQQITYDDLNKKANQLAYQLRERGVGREKIIGLMMERSPEMIIGIMGIMKAGAAYLPLDPEYPQDRLEYMLADSDTELLLTGSSSYQKASQVYQGQILEIDDDIFYGDETNPDVINGPEDLVYLIYTSGSTGRPKGVMVEHGSLMNTAYAWREEYNLGQMDANLLQMASFSFDVFAGDLARTMLNGGKMVICPGDYRLDYQKLHQLIIEEEINIFESTPALIIPFMDYLYDSDLSLDSLELLILGSDSCKVEDFKRILTRYNHQMRIINSYGLTEATIDTSYYEESYQDIIDGGNVPIGKPLPNMQTYVLDKDLKPQPIGVIGELYVGGKSLARGYLNRQELTEKRFIDNPFNPEERLYKTGDRARWLSDGNLEFLGRIDNQTKIRGYRIELGEIENLLLEKEEITNACLVARPDSDGNKYLAGYYTTSREITTGEIKDYLKESLPDYMVPTYLIKLEEMPLTANDKIDRKALPEPDIQSFKTEYRAAENVTEAKLIHIFKEILDVQRVGIDDDFFELGGHSLKATVMMGKILKEFGVQIPLRQIFKTPTVKGLSKYLQDEKGTIYQSIKQVDKREYYPLSSAQHQIYIVCQMEIDSINYNMPGVLVVDGQLDRIKVERTVEQLLERHSSLRTGFEVVDGEPVQKIYANSDIKVDYREYSQKISIDVMVEEFVRPFNLAEPPLFRIQLVDWGERQVLLFDLHHIIADGVSTDILFRDFSRLYAGHNLEKPAIQYQDYAVWQQDWIESGKLEDQAKFWHRQFEDSIPVLELPTDYERPSVIDYQGSTYSFELEEELTHRLNQLAIEEETTLFMVLLAGYQILLSKRSGQEEIVVGSPIAGRPHPDLENILGIFVNTLPFINRPEREKNFREYLREVKENALQVFENQDYPFERLINDLELKWDLSRNPIYDVVFVLQNTGEYEFELDNAKLKLHSLDIGIAKFDLTLRALEMEGKLNFELEYRTALFTKETIEDLAQGYLNLLESMVEEPTIEIKEMKTFSTEEFEIVEGDEFEDLDFDF